MKIVAIVSILGALLDASSLGQQNLTYQDRSAPVESRAEDLLSRMTLDEKIDMIGGQESFYIRQNERLSIPKIKMADGPLGVRNYGEATAFPATIAVTASWNRALMQDIGTAVGKEARSKGVHIMLAPAVNIHRAPMCGRNFEYLGEDPYLAGQMAASYVKGVQAQGVVTTVKHFALNNQEYDRHLISSDTDERTLQEIYLPAFKAAVDAGVGAVMTSYNLINGVHASEHRHLIQDILKGQWKFDGLVMSDWDSTYDGVRAANAGLDLEMPSGKFMNRQNLLPALKAAVIKEQTIDDKIRRLLRVMFRFGFFDRPQEDPSLPKYSPDSRLVALTAAREGIVLLKNKGKLLPLDRSKVKSILVIGPNAHPAVTGGGGSSRVHPFRSVSALEGLTQIGGGGVKIFYEKGLDNERGVNPVSVGFAAKTDAVVVVVGFNPSTEAEGKDRPFALTPEEEQLIREVGRLNPHTIVVLNAGGNVSMTNWVDSAASLLHSWYLGQEGGIALAEIIFGDVNPSGKLPVSFEKRWQDSSSYRSYYPQENEKRIAYAEGVFMGYRHFDKSQIPPMFPFGFGLSYTQFAYRNLKLSSARIRGGQKLRVRFEITNTGKCAGAEAAQLYLREVKPREARPLKELKGFAKVFLEPGQTKAVEIELGPEALSYYHAKQNAWQSDPGTFEVLIGSSSKDILLTQSFLLER
jgi:beta-glucosidase